MSKAIYGSVITGVIGLFIAGSVFGSFETIDQGERGVKLRYGEVIDTVEPGLVWKLPYTDTIKTLSVQNQTYRFEKVEAYSSDQQPASMRVSVTIKVGDGHVVDLYSQYGSIQALADRTIAPRVLDGIKNVFGGYTAQSAITKRQEFVMSATEVIREMLKDEPMTLVSVQVEELSFTDAYEKSIEDKQRAEVMVQTNTQTARALVAKAEGEKQAAIKKAEGDAQAVILAGEAEAQAIRARAKALADNPKLVDLVLAEKWDGGLPTTMVPNAGVPFLNVK